MKGFVPTPSDTVDLMVNLLFAQRSPTPEDFVLDPGCGTGEFIDGVIRWCALHRIPLPQIVGVDSDPRHLPGLLSKYEGVSQIHIEIRDYLQPDSRRFQYIVGNPPYVPITQLSSDEKARYRATYRCARGRFDLYLLFFEQALKTLANDGRLVLITPEKYLYVETAGSLRSLLSDFRVEEIRLANESTFGGLVTYPTITLIQRATPGFTRYISRSGDSLMVRLPSGNASWMSALSTPTIDPGDGLLADYCLRISCGVATGADGVFVRRVSQLSSELRVFGRPTIAGRELVQGSEQLDTVFTMLVPYDERGKLLSEADLGALGEYLNRVRSRLVQRTCVARKPWYAFHETPVLPEILRPKILCKDICERPHFVADYSGDIVPRHSVYYIVPHDPASIPAMLDYLRSDRALRWLQANAQRAAKGFLRMQSRTLQRLPVPPGLLKRPSICSAIADSSVDSRAKPQLSLLV